MRAAVWKTLDFLNGLQLFKIHISCRIKGTRTNVLLQEISLEFRLKRVMWASTVLYTSWYERTLISLSYKFYCRFNNHKFKSV